MRQPGFIATISTFIVLVLGVMPIAGSMVVMKWRDWGENLALLVQLAVGPAVAAAWMVQALAGRWRPERSWVDRLGRVLGAYWIAAEVVAILYFLK